MKRLLYHTYSCSAVLSPLAAQLYHPGEQLFYRVSYKAKMFPNTEVGDRGGQDLRRISADGKSYYKVEGARAHAAHLPLVLQPGGRLHRVDRHRSRCAPCASRATSAKATTPSRATTPTIWADSTIHTRWRSRKNPYQREDRWPLTAESMDPIALFFNLRVGPKRQNFRVGEPATLQMVLQDTIRHLQLPLPGARKQEDPQHGAVSARSSSSAS